MTLRRKSLQPVIAPDLRSRCDWVVIYITGKIKHIIEICKLLLKCKYAGSIMGKNYKGEGGI